MFRQLGLVLTPSQVSPNTKTPFSEINIWYKQHHCAIGSIWCITSLRGGRLMVNSTSTIVDRTENHCSCWFEHWGISVFTLRTLPFQTPDMSVDNEHSWIYSTEEKCEYYKVYKNYFTNSFKSHFKKNKLFYITYVRRIHSQGPVSFPISISIHLNF